jgi:hypothetical protein
MQPIVESKTRSGLGHRLAITALVGASVLSVAVVVLLSIYVDRISEMASGLRRVDALADYSGRPAPVQVADNPAVNFLIYVDAGPQLQAAVIANLSGSRRDLTLVSLPADLFVTEARASLAEAYASDPRLATQLVEQLTGARMDHQLQLELHGFGAVVDGLDGLDVTDQQLSGGAVVSYLAQADSSVDRSARAAELIRQTMIRAEADGGVLNLPRFDRVVSALGSCLTIDDGLTNDAIQAILVESRVHLSDVRLWPVDGTRAGFGTRVDPNSLAALRSGLATDALAETQQLGAGSVARVGTGVRSQSADQSTAPKPAAAPTSAVLTQTPADSASPTIVEEPVDGSTSSTPEPSPSASDQTAR